MSIASTKVSERSEKFLKSWKDNLTNTTYITPPQNSGWLEKKSSHDFWLTSKIFKSKSSTWKKKWICIEEFNIICRYEHFDLL